MEPLVSAVESPPFPIQRVSADRVRRAVVEAVQRHAKAIEALQLAIGECVRDLRDQGMTPEAMLVTMKAFIRQTAAAYPPPGRGPAWLTESVMENIVRWCINEYFRH